MFKALFYKPLYNALAYLTDIIPGHHLVLAIIILTLIVKFILFPLSKKAVITQMKIKLLEPELKEINEKFKGDRQVLAQKTMEIYKKNQLNPFSTLLLVIIQLPIFISLAIMFSRNALATVDASLLYSFVHVPEYINQVFLTIFNTSEKSIVLGAIAGILQFVQIRLTLPAYKKPEADAKPNFKDDLARSMNTQMRYVMPVIVFVASLGFKAAMSVYWIVSTIFTISQELYFRKTIKKNQA
jgi:YidC/Oxa1 family membrane protein insertase